MLFLSNKNKPSSPCFGHSGSKSVSKPNDRVLHGEVAPWHVAVSLGVSLILNGQQCPRGLLDYWGRGGGAGCRAWYT